MRELPKREFEVEAGAPCDGIFFERFQALGRVPPNDNAVLADAILSLISKPVRRRALGEAGRRRAI